MEATQQTETAPPTPEQLLKLLDLQLGQERSKRARKARHRGTLLAVGLLFIIVAGGLALFVAQQMLVEFQNRSAVPPLTGEVSAER